MLVKDVCFPHTGSPPIPNLPLLPTWNAGHPPPAEMGAIDGRCQGRERKGACGLSGMAVPLYQPQLPTLAFLLRRMALWLLNSSGPLNHLAGS